MAASFGPAAANENERRREAAILGHFLTVFIDGFGPTQPGRTVDGPIEARGLIDTGASDICIDYRLALELGLRAVDQVNVGVVGGSAMATVYLGRVVIPEIDFDQVMPVYAMKVRHATHEVLVGRSLLQNYIVTFDGPAGTFHFAKRQNEHLLGAIEDDYAT